jgi:hypothetical protein
MHFPGMHGEIHAIQGADRAELLGECASLDWRPYLTAHLRVSACSKTQFQPSQMCAKDICPAADVWAMLEPTKSDPPRYRRTR